LGGNAEGRGQPNGDSGLLGLAIGIAALGYQEPDLTAVVATVIMYTMASSWPITGLFIGKNFGNRSPG
jgi:hypothetical protein